MGIIDCEDAVRGARQQHFLRGSRISRAFYAEHDKALLFLIDSIAMPGLEILGFTAAILTTVCWLPQALRTLRTRDTKSLSLATQSVFTLGVALWLIYGIGAGNVPIIFANSITLILVALILAMKLRYG